MIISASQARAKLFPLIEQVNQDQAPITITSNNGNAVLVSESEWESILETAFILRTATNRAHIEQSMASLQRGEGIKRKHDKEETLSQLLELAGLTSQISVKAKKKVSTTKKSAKIRTAH